MINVADPWPPPVAHGDLHLVDGAPLLPPLLKVGLDLGLNLVRGLVGNDADGELAWNKER